MAVAMRLAAKFNSYYAEKPGKPLLNWYLMRRRRQANTICSIDYYGDQRGKYQLCQHLCFQRAQLILNAVGPRWSRGYSCAADHGLQSSTRPAEL